MTNTTELALLVSKAKASVFTLEYISQFDPADIGSDDVDLRFEVDGRDTGTNVSIVDECGQAAKVIGALVEALEKAQQVDEELCKLLPPGAEYMDPPDGGDVPPIEGVRRMVADYRQRIAELESRTVTDAAVKQLAAENVALKRFVSGSCYVFDGDHDDDMPDEFVDASNYLPLTPLTDNYLFKVWTLDTPKEILEIIDSGDLETICYESDRSYAEDYRLALYNFRQLREVADK